MSPAENDRAANEGSAQEIFSDRDLDPSAPPPPPEEQWERAEADGDPGDNMAGEAPTS